MILSEIQPPPPPPQYDQLHMIIIFHSVLMKTEYPMVSNETFSSLITLQSQNLCGFQRLIQIRFHINGHKNLCLKKHIQFRFHDA